MFFPQRSFARTFAPAGWSLEEVRFTARDGTKLSGVLARPPVASAPLVIYYGGNAEEITSAAPQADRFGPRAVLLVNYRGYGESEGKPGEAALVADAIELFDWAAARPDIDAARIAVHGRSLGTGVAVQVAAARPVRCLVLTSPFGSVREVAQSIYPWLPVSILLRHPFDSQARAPGLRQPALFLYAEDDTIIPRKHSEQLAAAWGGPVEKMPIAGRDHNDLELDSRYFPAIASFLDRHL
jgi:fermentation-respiration switch protein FrsA (DUF1100 family)